MMGSKPCEDVPSVSIVTWSNISTEEDKPTGKQPKENPWVHTAVDKDTKLDLHKGKETFMEVNNISVDSGPSTSKSQRVLQKRRQTWRQAYGTSSKPAYKYRQDLLDGMANLGNETICLLSTACPRMSAGAPFIDHTCHRMSAESVSRTVSHAIADARVPGSDGQCVPICNGAPTLEQVASGAHERATTTHALLLLMLPTLSLVGFASLPVFHPPRNPPARRVVREPGL